MELAEKKNKTGPPGDSLELEALRGTMTKRRMEVLRELKENDQLSQGELAQRIHAKPTALSNLLLKFDAFSPKLIEKQYVGKFCYYSLTDWGRRLVEEYPEPPPTYIRPDSAAQEKEDEFLFQTARTALEDMKQKYGEKWCVVFDDVLSYYLKRVKDIPDKGQRTLVNGYLKSLELLRIHQNDKQGNHALKLLTDGVHTFRIMEFMDDLFYPFIIVLKSLRDQELVYPLTSVLRHFFTRREGRPEADYIQALGWSKSSLEELEEAVKRITVRLEGCDEWEIYEYCTALLPEQEMLSRLISQWLGDSSTLLHRS